MVAFSSLDLKLVRYSFYLTILLILKKTQPVISPHIRKHASKVAFLKVTDIIDGKR